MVSRFRRSISAAILDLLAPLAALAPLASLALIASLSAAWLPTAAHADDIDTLINRYRQAFYNTASTPTEKDARALMASLASDGTWPDIDYTVTEAVNWNPHAHLDRIALLAKAYATPGHALAGNTEVAAKSALALDAWIRINPKSSNWWWNEIGSQLHLTPVVYLMQDRMTAGEKAGTDSLLARSWKSSARTGANLVWISKITLWRASLNRDEPLIKAAAAAIASTITVSTGDGIQPDFSFHQHGPQLYSGGYGAVFVADCVSMATDLKGTRFAFAPDLMDILARFLLEGDRWMIRGSTMDQSARGREVTRSGASSASGIGASAALLAAMVPNASKDLSTFAAAIKAQSGSSVDGNRYFWRSEYLTQHRNSHFISVRMASKLLHASEVVNNEGLLSQYLADGATFIYRSGKEYDDIFPVWDWCRVPGTTVAHADAPPAMKPQAWGVGDFAGGVSDGRNGAAAFDYAKLGVTARKAWFFFDGEMVALGAGISSLDPSPINTSINQCLLSGAVTAGTGTAAAPVVKIIPAGAGLTGAVRWIQHDRIGYVFPEGTANAALTNGKASGNWLRLNAAQSAANVDKDVFSLWIDHGKSPADAAYQYTILADVAPEEVAAYAAKPDVRILANTAALQAARHATLAVTEAVFYLPGTLNVTPSISVSPDRACILLLREENGRLVLVASDPGRGTADLHMRTNLKLEGDGAAWSETDKSSTVTMVLPKGDSAGASVSRTFAATGAVAHPQGNSWPGFTLDAGAVGGEGAGPGGVSIAYAVPGAGLVELSLLDAKGKVTAALFRGRVEAGAHAWYPGASGQGSAAAIGKPGISFVRLAWEGRVLLVPLRHVPVRHVPPGRG